MARQRQLGVEPRRLLVQVIREDLGLTGTHVGCDTTQCGACTVHVDGQAVKSCTMLAVQADGTTVTTIEGMAIGRRAAPAPAGVLGEPRPAVRLLHAGHDHGRGRPAGQQRGSFGPGDPPRHRGQHLPLHGLPEHRDRDPRGGKSMRMRSRVPRAGSRGTDEEAIQMAVDVFGAAIKRREDPRFITGEGNYLDDVKLPGMTYAAVLRSPYAHAKIESIDTTPRRRCRASSRSGRAPDTASVNPLPCAWPAGGVPNNLNTPAAARRRHGPLDRRGHRPRRRRIARDRERRARRRSTSATTRCRSWSTRRRRCEPGAPQLHENAPNNVVMNWSVGPPGRDGRARSRRPKWWSASGSSTSG